jgi:hypothetical protein
MPLKTFSCREHGGTFQMLPRKGRPPVRCTAEAPCSRVGTPKSAPTVSAEQNPCLPKAKAAKERLVSLGWTAKGKHGTAPDGTAYATLSASRDTETLLIAWKNGKMIDQQYSLFSEEEATDSNMPADKLTLDPDELTDRELVDWVKGMKVTWWNTIAQSSETFTVGDKVAIEHVFDPDKPEKRIVKFIARDGHGFRAFDVRALLKVG